MDHFSVFASKAAFHTWPTGVGARNEAVARNISLMNCSRCVETPPPTTTEKTTLKFVFACFPV